MQKPITRVAIAGHRSHGKTALLGAIMRLVGRGGPPVGSFEFETHDRRFIMIEAREGAGDVFQALQEAASRALVLVISAEEGPLQGTLEAVQGARQAGAQHAFVFLNKCDKIEDPELLDLVEMEARELLNKYRFDGDTALAVRGAAGIEGHSRVGEAVPQLLAALTRAG